MHTDNEKLENIMVEKIPFTLASEKLHRNKFNNK